MRDATWTTRVMDANVETRHSDDEAVLRLSGEFDLATVPLLERALTAVREVATGRVVLDCTDLEFLDCSVLGAVVRHLRSAPGTEIVFRAPAPFVIRVLGLVGWSDLIERG